GRSQWIYNGNWKLQVDNSDDTYHLGPAHTSFTDIVGRRQAGSTQGQIDMPDWNERLNADGGMYTFDHGHSRSWIGNLTPSNRPIYSRIEELRARVGRQKAHWMLQNRNLTLYPSVQLCDSTSMVLRTIRPIDVDKTEMTLYCLAPIGESAESR